MTEQANSDANPATEDPTSTPSYEDLLAQNKGLQRANQRYRDDIGVGIKNDAISKEVELSRQSNNELMELLKNSPLMDPDTAAALDNIREKSARVLTDLEGETILRSEIATTLGNANLDYDDDSPEMEILRTHYDAGNNDKVRDILSEIKSKNNPDLDAMVEAKLQERLKARGLPVDAGNSAGGASLVGKDKIFADLDSGTISPEEAMRQALADS
jgi:hypothetical protein|tara:strand:- start:5468 stop:6112 length:645 start_codon:yes stop_codon:yes gene_type:complete